MIDSSGAGDASVLSPSPLENTYCNGEVVYVAGMVTASSVEVPDCVVLDPPSQDVSGTFQEFPSPDFYFYGLPVVTKH